MATSARLDLTVERNDDVYEFRLLVRGPTLTDVSLAMEIRVTEDAPGAALVALAKVTNGNAEGLRVAGSAVVGGVPETDVRIRINKSTLAGLPYAGEVGDATSLAYALLIGGATRLKGAFVLLPTAYGSDNAPANRAPSSGTRAVSGATGSAVLTVADREAAILSVDGLDVIEQVAQAAEEVVQAVADQALVSAGVAETLSGAKVAVPVSANPNELTAPNLASPAANATFEVLLTSTNTGETWLTVGGLRRRVSNGGGVSIGAGGLVAGTIVSLTNSAGGGVFVLNGSRPLPGTAAALAPLTGKVDATSQIAERLSGAPIAYPVGGSVNELSAPTVAALAVGDTFEVLLTATNTGETYLTAGAVRLRIANGGGASIGAGGLVAGTIINLTRSGGGAFVLNSTRALVPAASLEGGDDGALMYRPFGTVDFSSGSRAVAPVQAYVVTPGSSNAAASNVPAGSIPADMIAGALNDEWPADGVVIVPDNRATAGAPMTAIGGQLAASTAFQNRTARWVIPFFWMNDARTVYYHAQGGIGTQLAALEASIEAIRKGGAEPVLVTGFHPDPRASATALDPNYFAENAGVDMVYPAFKAHPVDPEADMWPKRSDLMVARDWTGGGVQRTGFKRLFHVNRLIRRLAAETDCVLIDLEKACFRLCNETVADLGGGLDTFYDQADPLHPKAPLFQQGVRPALRQWARAVAAGDFGRRVFTGF